MKAILIERFGGPEVLQFRDVEDPKPPAGQVLVRLKAIGVNPVDAYIRSGNYIKLPDLPYIPGADGAGIVEQLGEGVTRFQIGDRVYLTGPLTGTYAELASWDANHVQRLPDRVSFAQGAAVGVPYTTAYRALFQRANARPAETVFVHGATGGVGLATVELARVAGMTVIGTGGTEQGTQVAKEHGAHFVLDHHQEGYLDEVVRITGGKGPDVIVEMLANVNLDKDLKILAKRGRIVVVGNRGRIEVDPRAAMTRDAAILGMTLFNVSLEDRISIYAALTAGLENGTLNPVIWKELPLTEAAEAHRLIMESGKYGKIVLIP